MTPRPKNLNEVWTEEQLCEHLGLTVGDTGRSRQLSNWVKGGLKFVKKSGQRYFFEQDVIDYLYGRYAGQWPDISDES